MGLERGAEAGLGGAAKSAGHKTTQILLKLLDDCPALAMGTIRGKQIPDEVSV